MWSPSLESDRLRSVSICRNRRHPIQQVLPKVLSNENVSLSIASMSSESPSDFTASDRKRIRLTRRVSATPKHRVVAQNFRINLVSLFSSESKQNNHDVRSPDFERFPIRKLLTFGQALVVF